MDDVCDSMIGSCDEWCIPRSGNLVRGYGDTGIRGYGDTEKNNGLGKSERPEAVIQLTYSLNNSPTHQLNAVTLFFTLAFHDRVDEAQEAVASKAA